jgi:hypothetical protein
MDLELIVLTGCKVVTNPWQDMVTSVTTNNISKTRLIVAKTRCRFLDGSTARAVGAFWFHALVVTLSSSHPLRHQIFIASHHACVLFVRFYLHLVIKTRALFHDNFKLQMLLDYSFYGKFIKLSNASLSTAVLTARSLRQQRPTHSLEVGIEDDDIGSC